MGKTIAPLQTEDKPRYTKKGIPSPTMTAEELAEAENLAKRFPKGVVNQAKFARDNGVPGGGAMIHQHIVGLRPISMSAAIAYAKGFGCSLEEISPRLAEKARKSAELLPSSYMQTLASGAESNLDPAPDLRPSRMLPVVGEVQGGVDGYLQELAYPVGYGEGCVEYPTGDLNAYALRVRGDSMHPRYRAGEFVIIEPSIQPPEGEDVIVCCKDGRKMLKILNWIRDGEAQFLSVNNGYAPLTMLLGDIESIQLVAGSVRRSAFIKA